MAWGAAGLGWCGGVLWGGLAVPGQGGDFARVHVHLCDAGAEADLIRELPADLVQLRRGLGGVRPVDREHTHSLQELQPAVHHSVPKAGTPSLAENGEGGGDAVLVKGLAGKEQKKVINSKCC